MPEPQTTHTVELDYASSMYDPDPVVDAVAWVADLGANVRVITKTDAGHAGGHPVLAFTGTRDELRKVLLDYYHDDGDMIATTLLDLDKH